MRQDSVSIARFYETGLGQAAAWALSGRIEDLWQNTARLNLLGLGYPQPLMEPFASEARSLAAVFPESAGHVRWNGAGRGNCTVLAPEARLPFGDGVFDRALLLHTLEEAENPRAVCRELWRVMAPEGRIVVAAANRRGLWARADRTPFGQGRPWTLRQLSGLLTDCAFQVTASTHALFMPPLDLALVWRGAHGWERAGRWIAPGFGGVVLVEAVKRLYIDPGGGAVAPVVSPARARARTAAAPQRQADRRPDDLDGVNRR